MQPLGPYQEKIKDYANMLTGLLDSHAPQEAKKSHLLSKIDSIKNALTDCEKLYSEELSRPEHYARKERYIHANAS